LPAETSTAKNTATRRRATVTTSLGCWTAWLVSTPGEKARCVQFRAERMRLGPCYPLEDAVVAPQLARPYGRNGHPDLDGR
jgi:hypothetical protein